jgi:3-methyladenine DNA glycosylase/8-oxoguanine DNA glycosylase
VNDDRRLVRRTVRGGVGPPCYGRRVAAPTLAPPHEAPQDPVLRPDEMRVTLGPLRNGHGDPTTRIGPFELVRATHTPDGPGTLRVRWGPAGVRSDGWGPGGAWMVARTAALVGLHDAGHRFEAGHPAILRAQRNTPHLRFAASGTLYHELLPAILAQRISSGEAMRQWRRLCLELGDHAPGPFPELRLPPCPSRLATTPSWWFHPLGIERKRAQALIEVARHAERIAEWSAMSAAAAASSLLLLRGVGEWTIGVVLAVAHGEPDALAVGDYHLKNIVVHALTGRARGTDEEMVELLEPYRGQRGRVARLLVLDGQRAPKFGPRRRILPMHRW